MTIGKPGTTITTQVSLSLKQQIKQHADEASQTLQDYVRDAIKTRIAFEDMHNEEDE